MEKDEGSLKKWEREVQSSLRVIENSTDESKDYLFSLDQNAKDMLHSIRRLQDTVADNPIGMTTISDDTKHIDNSVGFIVISIAFIGFWHTVLLALILWRVW